MSLDKAIQHHKEHRRPYRGAKAIDPTCRNHGSDDWAKGNRLYAAKRREAAAESAIRDYGFQEGMKQVPLKTGGSNDEEKIYI